MKKDYFKKKEGGELRNKPTVKMRDDSNKRLHPVLIFAVIIILLTSLIIFL